MGSLQTILLVLQVLVAISLIGLILIQHGKGADAGAAFGSGASSTVFGSQGSSNFLTKTTAILAFVFLTNSLTLAYLSSRHMRTQTSLMQQSQPLETQPAQMPANNMDQSANAEKEDIPVIPESDKELPAAPKSDVPAIPDK